MSKRILVVEDQKDERQIIRDVLAATDYEIAEAEDGEQALAAVAKERPDDAPSQLGHVGQDRRLRVCSAVLPLTVPAPVWSI
jgi:CheY-like chemotaxis protein